MDFLIFAIDLPSDLILWPWSLYHGLFHILLLIDMMNEFISRSSLDSYSLWSIHKLQLIVYYYYYYYFIMTRIYFYKKLSFNFVISYQRPIWCATMNDSGTPP